VGGAAALTTVAALLESRAGDDRPALVVADDPTRRWTWAEVVGESRRRAAALASLRVEGRPFHVGVLLANVPEYVFVLGGAALTGAVVVGINPTRRGEELARDVRHTDCVVVLTDATHRSLLDGLDLGGARVVAVDGGGWPVDGPAPTGAPADDDLFLLLFTSGSTGAPKAVKVSHGRAARTAAASAVAFTPEDVLYCAMPLFHGNALFSNLLAAVVSGASVVLKERFSASSFAADVRRHGCTFFNYVGRALSYVLAVPEAPDDADNRLRWGLGSEASPRDIKEFRRRFGCPVVEGYGSSEGAVVLTRAPGMPPGALGRPREGDDVAVLDPATGEPCPPGVIGEIVGRSGLRHFEGYWNNPEAEAERSRQGWYWTGDLAYVDGEGVFFFAGRSADWLRVDGENFAAAPVERVLGRFRGVASVAVYGVPDPSTGDAVMAALELDPDVGFEPEAFAAFLAEQPDLGTKWAPRFVRVAPSLPTTATGKLDKQPLRRDRWDAADPVWWRPPGSPAYRRFTAADGEELRRAFDDAGRADALTR
jgi:fatty-acyl-CoA synthase